MIKVGLYGAGGNGREAVSILSENLADSYDSNSFEIFFIETNPIEIKVNEFNLIPEKVFITLPTHNTSFNVSISSPKVRREIVARLKSCGFDSISIKSRLSAISKDSVIGKGIIIAQFVFVGPNTEIGEYVHLNYFSSVSHDVKLGDFVSVGPGARVNGYTVIEDNVVIGAQAVIKPGTVNKPRVIGKGAIIGMGAVVTSDIDAGATVAGNPARLLTSKPQ
jgi:sugar O-acyltransferase (sialic acid O-acetyltransferase NeuD family)